MEKIKLQDVINIEYNCSELPTKYNQPEYNTYTNFFLKHKSIIDRLIYLNQYIDNYYKNWLFLTCEPKINKSSEQEFFETIQKHKEWQRKLINNYFEQEELIMHLRKSIDDCISLWSIATNTFFTQTKKKNKALKEKIIRPFESIGDLLNQIDKLSIFKEHKDYLSLINDISNGFKHCVTNSITLKIGKDEPCIFVYENKDLCLKEHGVTLNELIVGFNKFFNTFCSIIKQP